MSREKIRDVCKGALKDEYFNYLSFDDSNKN